MIRISEEEIAPEITRTPRWRDIARRQVMLLGGFVVLIWTLEIVDSYLLRGVLDTFGIVPRNVTGLRGVVLAPLLHSGLGHVAANTVPFLVLGWLILWRGGRTFVAVSAIVLLISGLGTWLIGPARSVHIGASGLVFGYLGYLILRGYYDRRLASILVALGVVALYGGFVWGLLPQGNGISWQGHLFGFIGGWVAAYVLHQRVRERPLRIEVD